MALHIVTSLQTIAITIVGALFQSFKNKKERQKKIKSKEVKERRLKPIKGAIRKSIILYCNIQKIYNLVELKYF